MLPVLALVGRPNVGKSTLFNRLTRSRDAIVDDQPGVTRDRLYGRGRIDDRHFLAVDTGGLDEEAGRFGALIRQQVEQVMDEAHHVLFVVDARDGLVPADRDIANLLRQREVSVQVVVNKAEGLEPELVTAEFQELGLGEPQAVSARRGDGIADVVNLALGESTEEEAERDDSLPAIALVGRPNVGKSTLTNKLVGEARVLVSDEPGTTRDSVRIPCRWQERDCVLIDTAGVRRRARVSEAIEKFSVIKTLQAIESANVALLVLDATGEIGAQDATIAGMVHDLGRSLVLVVNKWDGLENRQRSKIKAELELKLPFLPDPEILFISALKGSNLAEVMPAAFRAYDSAMAGFTTANLNRVLADALAQTPPPMHRQRPVRLKFAHQAGRNPPVIVVHGAQAEKLPESYRRYLARFFARAYRLRGTPVRVIPRTGRNPFEGRKSRETDDRKKKKRSTRR